jgi:hypothetical protein
MTETNVKRQDDNDLTMKEKEVLGILREAIEGGVKLGAELWSASAREEAVRDTFKRLRIRMLKLVRGTNPGGRNYRFKAKIPA